MITAIIGGTVITNGKAKKTNVYIENKKIKALTNEILLCDQKIDASGLFVSPGFIDIHTHGAGGADFLDGTVDAYLTAAKMQAHHGATTIIPTTTSVNVDDLASSFAAYDEAVKQNAEGANMPGLHLEGPYFALSQKGAQDERFVRPIVKDEYEQILKIGKGRILRWSVAPEIDGAIELGKRLKLLKILPSIAHSDADNFAVDKAFAVGYTHVTHLYSCTSTVHRKNAFRYAGIVESAYLNDAMTVEIIADGVHLPASLLKLVYKIKGVDSIALITDSMRAAGLGEGKSILGGLKNGMEVIVEDNVAKLPDRSAFAGSVATCDVLVKNMVQLAGVPLPEAVKMATQTPAKIMGLKDKGELKVGYDADIVLFDENIQIDTVFVLGKAVFTKNV